jgi:hypothetical protein
MSANDP